MAAAGIVTLLVLAPDLRAADSRYECGSHRDVCRVIRHVFGRYGDEAIRVASCESGLSIWARNGQYLGLFQHGEYARARYGFAWNAWAQTRAAYRYFVDSGRDWSPWSCRWAAL